MNIWCKMEDDHMEAMKQRVQNLIEALPYIKQFRQKVFVIKYGGSIMENDAGKAALIEDIALLSHLGIKCILVHGGGKEISSRLARLGIESEFKVGYRVTSAEAIDEVEMVLTGRINKELTCLLNNSGVKTVGLNGKDAGLIKAKQKYIEVESEKHDIGHVGEICEINPEIIEILLSNQIVPVISPIGFDEQGMTFNINADDVAAALSATLGAEKLILITDVSGVMRDLNDPESIISKLKVDDIKTLESEGIIAGGMIPKMKCVQQAILEGAKSVHILNGKTEHCVLLEVFTNAGIGTMITP